MKFIGFITALCLFMAAQAHSEERAAYGKILAVGEQAIINGFPVSCQAPLLTEGYYTMHCANINANSRAELRVFLQIRAKTNASSREIKLALDQQILERRLNPNDLQCLDGWYGPYATEQTE